MSSGRTSRWAACVSGMRRPRWPGRKTRAESLWLGSRSCPENIAAEVEFSSRGSAFCDAPSPLTCLPVIAVLDLRSHSWYTDADTIEFAGILRLIKASSSTDRLGQVR